MRIFATPAPAFFMREKPISSRANPACMNITRTPATITQVVSTADAVSDRLGPAAAAATGTPSSAASAPAHTRPTSLLLAGVGAAAPVARLIMDCLLVAPAVRAPPAGVLIERRRQSTFGRAGGHWTGVGNLGPAFRPAVEVPLYRGQTRTAREEWA